MQASRLSAALLFTSSAFLIHCSGDDTPSDGNHAGTSSTMAGTTSGGSAGTGTGGTGGSSAGTGGSAGPAGSGGTSGAGGTGATGAGGTGATGAGGMTGSAGRGTAGMSGSGMAGSGTAGSGMTGAGGSAAGASGAGGATGGSGGRAAGGTGMGGSSSGAMTLTSSVIMEGGMFPDANTCASGTSGNKSPDLTWTAGPSGTMSYAVILLDTSITYNHWVIWDIPANVTSLPAALDSMAMPAMPAGAKQKGIQGNGYFGPCPNGQDHVYKFTVYALPVATLSGAMTSEMTSALAMDVMNANPLASASLSAHSNASMN